VEGLQAITFMCFERIASLLDSLDDDDDDTNGSSAGKYA
jgi:hypothetical protein